MAAARRQFGPGNPYGVQAFGIDRKVTCGRRLRTSALNVYVVHKQAAPTRAVPPLIVRSRGLRVRPDVVGVGAQPTGHDAKRFAPPLLGLYAGAAIHVQGRVRQFGGVTCLLGDGARPTHLLTAGHLFPKRQPNVEVLAARRGEAPSVIGRLQVNLLDAPFPELEHPLDVALVALTPRGVRMAEASQDGPKLCDFVASDTLAGAEVSAFLPTAHDCSRPTELLDGPLDAQMRSAARGVYFVQQVVGTRAAISNPGDSGTILYNGPLSAAFAVGICVGQFGAMTIFEPFERALLALRAGTGLPLSLV
jgi:hypothetical protein